MYRCADLAEEMVWHAKHCSTSSGGLDIMRLMVDSPLNQFVEGRWPEFKTDPRHVRLGVALDGISPYKLASKAQPYLVWPVVVTNYNIAPWQSMKKGFLMLTLIIPGPKQAKFPDTYLQLLHGELERLWRGVSCYDGCRRTGGLNRNFTLKGINMGTTHDLPGTSYMHNATCQLGLFILMSS